MKLIKTMGFMLIFSMSVTAEEELADAPLPPDLPDPIESGQALEPEVTIIRKEDKTIEEYRINGHLYKVKVTPVLGPPYYMYDRDGDGTFDPIDQYEGTAVPQWVLFEWD